MLKINGTQLMETFHVKPGPQIGWVLNALLEEVLEDPKLNTEAYLMSQAKQLISLPEEELKKLGKASFFKRLICAHRTQRQKPSAYSISGGTTFGSTLTLRRFLSMMIERICTGGSQCGALLPAATLLVLLWCYGFRSWGQDQPG